MEYKISKQKSQFKASSIREDNFVFGNKVKVDGLDFDFYVYRIDKVSDWHFCESISGAIISGSAGRSVAIEKGIKRIFSNVPKFIKAIDTHPTNPKNAAYLELYKLFNEVHISINDLFTKMITNFTVVKNTDL